MEGTVAGTPEGHLRMPEGTIWPFANHPLLFVREPYDPLYTKVFHQLEQRANSFGMMSYPKRILTGQPGIGKSMFGMYVIYRLLTEPTAAGVLRSVMYITGTEESIYVIDRESATVRRVGGHSRASDVFSEYSAQLAAGMVVVSDSFLPPLPGNDCAMLVISSPGVLARARRKRSNLWTTYLYGGGVPLCMPVPSLVEIESLRLNAFDSMDEDVFKARLEFWGPIPRRLFSMQKGIDAAYAHAARKIDVATIFNAADFVAKKKKKGEPAVGYDAPAYDAPHRYILQRCAGEEFFERNKVKMKYSERYFYPAKQTYFTSDAWFKLAMKKDAEKNWRMFEKISTSLSDARMVRSAMGSIFEARSCLILSRGGKFPIRDLRSGEMGKIRITEGTPIRWEAKQSLKALCEVSAGAPLIPESESNPGVDVICFAVGVVPKESNSKRISNWSKRGLGEATHVPMNMTISKAHEINTVGITNVAEGLGWSAGGVKFPLKETRKTAAPKDATKSKEGVERPFIFVIPSELFLEEKHWIAGCEQHTTAGFSYPTYGSLHQYVMGVDATAEAPPKVVIDAEFWVAADRWTFKHGYPMKPTDPTNTCR